ncbi:MAG: Lrp/AsnC family transcriptional regulator [Beijerinckiaceae bacterium]
MRESGVNLDRLDVMLLRELNADGRASHIELSQRVGLSSTACARRISALEGCGVIKGFTVTLDLAQVGLPITVLVKIALDSQAEEAMQAFEREVARCASVVRCLLMSGSDDYVLTVLARDVADFEAIHRSQLSKLPRVARMQSSFALREVVARSAPPVLFQQIGRSKT